MSLNNEPRRRSVDDGERSAAFLLRSDAAMMVGCRFNRQREAVRPRVPISAFKASILAQHVVSARPRSLFRANSCTFIAL